MRRKDRKVEDKKTIISILDTCKTAIIAMIDQNTPYVLPLSYGYEQKDDSFILYFHCAKEGRKIEILKSNNKVSFTIFHEGEASLSEIPCNSGYYYSSIVGDGVAEFVEDTADKRHALNKIFIQQFGKDIAFSDAQANSVCIFKIIVKNYTGKQKVKIIH